MGERMGERPKPQNSVAMEERVWEASGAYPKGQARKTLGIFSERSGTWELGGSILSVHSSCHVGVKTASGFRGLPEPEHNATQ